METPGTVRANIGLNAGTHWSKWGLILLYIAKHLQTSSGQTRGKSMCQVYTKQDPNVDTGAGRLTKKKLQL